MSLTRKQQLYKFLEACEFAPADSELEEFVMHNPWVRVKGLGSRGTTLINLSQDGGWIDPKSWAVNYRSGKLMQLEQAIKESWGVLPQKDIIELLRANGIQSQEPRKESDKSEIQLIAKDLALYASKLEDRAEKPHQFLRFFAAMLWARWGTRDFESAVNYCET
jgi:hypothetical protein